jgi:hypothetical protein
MREELSGGRGPIVDMTHSPRTAEFCRLNADVVTFFDEIVARRLLGHACKLPS